MNLVELLMNLQTAVADANVAAQVLAAEKYQQGFTDGINSRAEFVFTQADIDAKLAEIEALKAEIELLKQGSSEKKYSQEELDLAVAEAVASAVTPAVEAAKAALKEQMLALVADFKAKDDATEDELQKNIESL
jgi:hypothetical protein